MRKITPELLAKIAARRQERQEEIQLQEEANEKLLSKRNEARLKADDVLGAKKTGTDSTSTSARINPHKISTEAHTKPKKPSSDSDGGLELELTMGPSKTNPDADKNALEEDKDKNQTYSRRSQVDRIGYDPRTNSPEARQAAVDRVKQRVEREKTQQNLRPQGLGLER